jgi:hypothetical protein
MRSQASICATALLVASVSAHGNITSPPARLTGPAMLAACGQTAVSNVDADPTIPLEDVFNTLPGCQLDLCRGAKFEDNVDRVQTFTAGQVVHMTAIRKYTPAPPSLPLPPRAIFPIPYLFRQCCLGGGWPKKDRRNIIWVN